MAKKEKSATKKPRIWDGRGDRLERMRFTLLPGNVADDLRVKGLHFRLLAHIGRQNAERGWCRISQSELAEKWGFNRGSINKVLKALVSWGYIEGLTQQESRESWCAYRVVIDAKDADEGVSPPDDTPSSSATPARKGGVSSTDDRGVISSRQECHPPGDTHHTDKTDKTDQQERERADAHPAPDDEVHVIEGDVIEPTKGKPKPHAWASAAEASEQTDLWGKASKPARRRYKSLAEAQEAGWAPSQRTWEVAARLLGSEGLAKEEFVLGFAPYWLGEGKRKEDWDQAFVSWVGREVKKQRERRKPPTGRGSRFSVTDHLSN